MTPKIGIDFGVMHKFKVLQRPLRPTGSAAL